MTEEPLFVNFTKAPVAWLTISNTYVFKKASYLVPYKPLIRISYLVGYEDVNSFRKVFMKIIGLTPSRFRSRFLSENDYQTDWYSMIITCIDSMVYLHGIGDDIEWSSRTQMKFRCRHSLTIYCSLLLFTTAVLLRYRYLQISQTVLAYCVVCNTTTVVGLRWTFDIALFRFYNRF